MIRIFDVLLALITPLMAGNEFALGIETDPFRVGFELYTGAGILGRDRIAIAIEADAKLIGGADRFRQGTVERLRVQRL